MDSKPQNLPWVEKYRPKRVQDVAHQHQVVNTLLYALEDGHADVPHLLFYGPPGTGKTTTALALCRQLFGPALFRTRVLELNASDERGIRVVRERVKTFAQTTISAPPPNESGRKPPPFKVVILDEADAITGDAQTALRRTMETFSKHTRFILICNYISRIIGPLASRCAKFRFQPLPRDAMKDQLRMIAVKQNIDISDAHLLTLVDSCDGDMRKAITSLQSAHRMAKAGDRIDDALIATVTCTVPESVISAFEEAAVGSPTFKSVQEQSRSIIDDGYSVSQLLQQYSRRLVPLDDGSQSKTCTLADLQKSAIALKLAEVESRLIDSADEWLQLLDAGARIQVAANGDASLERLLQDMV